MVLSQHLYRYGSCVEPVNFNPNTHSGTHTNTHPIPATNTYACPVHLWVYQRMPCARGMLALRYARPLQMRRRRVLPVFGHVCS